MGPMGGDSGISIFIHVSFKEARRYGLGMRLPFARASCILMRVSLFTASVRVGGVA